MPVIWVAAACLSIAINGSRGLPQYFLQAAPALALAAGVGLTLAIPPLPALARWAVVLVIAVGAWRVGTDPFPKLAANVWHDTQYLLGRIDRRTHLARYGGARDVDKFSALDNRDLGAFLAQGTAPADTVYVFGFSPGAYVYADRRSASRFFWSRPVILDFNRDDPALRGRRPARRSAAVAACVRGAAAARLVPGRVRLGAVLPLAAGARGMAARRLSPGGVDRGLRRVAAQRFDDAPQVRARAHGDRPAGDRDCGRSSLPPILPGARPSASSGTTRVPGSTTRATRRSSAQWRQDAWNPVFIAPVFTALEYASFAAFGVGVRQARLVCEVAGVLSVLLLALGMRRAAGDTRGTHRRRPARDELRLRDVRPRRHHGRPDGGLHRRLVVLLGARGAGARVGRRGGPDGDAGVLHQGRGGVLSRRPRTRRAHPAGDGLLATGNWKPATGYG